MTQPAAAIATHDDTGKPVRRYLIPPPDGGDVLELPNISSVLDVLQAWGLTDWKLRMAAAGLVSSVDLAARVAVALPMPGGPQRNRQILDAVSDAIDLGQRLDPDRGHLANDYGTAIHLLTEHIDAGLVDDPLALPTSVAEHAAHYVTLMAQHGVEVVESEFTVYSSLGYAGTGDRIVRFAERHCKHEGLTDHVWPCRECDPHSIAGGCFVLDIKTGKAKPNAAMQLAALANADSIWDHEAQQHRPLPDDLRRDVGFVLHLQADGAWLIPADLTAAWPAFVGALAVQRFCETKPLAPALVAAVEENGRAGTTTPATSSPDLFDTLAASVTQAKAERAATTEAEHAEATALLEDAAAVPPSERVPLMRPTTCHRCEGTDDAECTHGAKPTHISAVLPEVIAAIPDDPDAGQVDAEGKRLLDRRQKSAWLTGRIKALLDLYPDRAADEVRTHWPEGVPTLAQAREAGELHTIEQLDAIEQVVRIAERELQAPFPPEDPSSTNDKVAADDPRVEEILHRFAALPPDLKDQVAADAAVALEGRRFTIGNATEDDVTWWLRTLEPAEADAALAAEQATNAAGVLAAYELHISPDHLLHLVGNYVDAPTVWQANRLDELADALGLEFLDAVDGELQISDAGKAHLEKEFGGRRGVVNAAKAEAERWGRTDRPTKADDVYADVLLCAALAMTESEPTQISPQDAA